MKKHTTTGRGWNRLVTRLSALFLLAMLCVGFSACQNTTATTSSTVVKNLIAGNTYSYKKVLSQTQGSVTEIAAYVYNITFSNDSKVKIVQEEAYGTNKEDVQIETDTIDGTYTTNDSDYTVTVKADGSNTVIKVATDGQSLTISNPGNSSESMTLTKGSINTKDLYPAKGGSGSQGQTENPEDSTSIDISGIEVWKDNDGTYSSASHILTFGKAWQGAGVYTTKDTSKYNAIVLTYKNATKDFRFKVSYKDESTTENVALAGSGTSTLLLDSSKDANGHYIMIQSEGDSLSVQIESIKLTTVKNVLNLKDYGLWEDENGKTNGEYNKDEHTINVSKYQGGGIWTGLDTSDYNTLTLTYRYASSDFWLRVSYDDDTTTQITVPAGTHTVAIPLDATKKKDHHYIGIASATNDSFYVQLIDLRFEQKDTLFTITYDANDGSTNPAKEYQTVTEINSKVTLRANTFKRSGYRFIGWSKYSQSTIEAYKDKDTIYSINTDLTLYAVWAPNTFTVTYNKNDGSANPATVTQTVTLNDIDSNGAFTLKPNTFTRNGYVFKGWNTYQTATYARYTDGVKTSYVNRDTTLYAIWEEAANQLVITFNANDGSANPATTTQAVDYGVLVTLNKNAFTRSGYKFKGWALDYPDSTSTLINDEGSYIFVKNNTLYAIWEVSECTVTFNANGGSGTMANQKVSYDYSSKLNANTFTRSGYTFSGWATSSTATQAEYPDTAWIKPSVPSLTLYAVWKSAVTVTFNGNGGTLADGSTTTTQTVASSADTKLKANEFTKQGYSFAGWGTYSSATSAKYKDEETLSISSSTTLYAIWKQDIDVMIDPNGGSGVTRTVYAKYSGDSEKWEFVIPECNFTKSGYKIAGWASSKDAATPEYQTGDTARVSQTCTIYAIWVEPTITTISVKIPEVSDINDIVLTYDDESHSINASLTGNSYFYWYVDGERVAYGNISSYNIYNLTEGLHTITVENSGKTRSQTLVVTVSKK